MSKFFKKRFKWKRCSTCFYVHCLGKHHPQSAVYQHNKLRRWSARAIREGANNILKLSHLTRSRFSENVKEHSQTEQISEKV